MQNMIYIGIDPDAVKSGVAVWDSEKKKLIRVMMLSFFELFSFLMDYISIGSTAAASVYLEAGWLNRKWNWHEGKKGVNVASRIGANVGANHQTGKLIEEMCKYLKIPCTLVLPQGKVGAKYFSKLTGMKKSNQDIRDAVMLVLNR